MCIYLLNLNLIDVIVCFLCKMRINVVRVKKLLNWEFLTVLILYVALKYPLEIIAKYKF